MDGIIITHLKRIDSNKGFVCHGMKKNDPGYEGFGEAYFSNVKKNQIKGWKKHTKMTLNIIVVSGEIEFIIYNENEDTFQNIKLSFESSKRLTIKPGLWVAFRGLKHKNTLLNIASVKHSVNEEHNLIISEIQYDW